MKYIRETILIGALLIGSLHGEQAKNPLIGKWKVKKIEGMKYGDQVAADAQAFFAFDKNEIVVTSTDPREVTRRMKYVIDTTKTPHWITANFTDDHTGKKKDKWLGIFRFVGDELHIKWAAMKDGERPVNFNEGGVGKFTKTVKK